MAIHIIVNGASGKMGSAACAALENDKRFEVVGKLGRNDNLSQTIQDTKADVVLDLTRADGVYQNACTIIKSGARPVIGTSGLSEEQRRQLGIQCKELARGGLIVPNFSIGVLLMMSFAKKAAHFFSDVEIIEMHHTRKFDSPSSTAIKTASMIAEGRDKQVLVPKGEGRGVQYDGVPIHALRLPGVLAKQSVIFGGVGEQLVITHESMDRECFMPGVLIACEAVMGLNALEYGLEHVIGL